jgi:hypothetical protein
LAAAVAANFLLLDPLMAGWLLLLLTLWLLLLLLSQLLPLAVSLLLVAWNESGTDAAGTSVDAQGCEEEIEKGFEAISRLEGESYGRCMVWSGAAVSLSSCVLCF